ncbi:hypothetical protein BGX30_004203 [Mortierella sp. GBA39]|nr:hypothetical protein BGX30_004203 [Mortierella sp. GBA39]
MAFSFENWDNMIKISTELYESAYEMYVEQKERNRRLQVTERPIVYYFGYSHLMKGLAYQKKKMYQEAKQCIANYEDLSYMSDGSPANNQAVENFRFFARANMFTLNILSGNLDCLEDYSAFIQENPSETLPGLITILEAANIHNYDVDHILDILVVEDSQLIPIDQNPNRTRLSKKTFSKERLKMKKVLFSTVVALGLFSVSLLTASAFTTLNHGANYDTANHGANYSIQNHAVPARTKPVPAEPRYPSRSELNYEEKRAIGTKAAELVTRGQCIILDASSSVLELAKALVEHDYLTVVTNGLEAGTILNQNPRINVILIGGILRSGSKTIEGVLGKSILEGIHSDLFFTSAEGLSVREGMTDFSLYEAELKKLMIASSSKTVALVDHTKLGRRSIATSAKMEDIDVLITDEGADPEFLRQLGTTEVLIAPYL